MKRRMVGLALVMMCLTGLVARAEVVGTIGSVADTYVSGSDVMGAKDYMSIYGGSTDDAGYVRFDLGAINVKTVLDAQLVLRNSPTVDSAGHDERNDGINAGRFALYGLNNVAGNTPQDWDESTLTETTAGTELTGGFPKTDFTDGRLANLDGGVEGVAITESIVDDPALDYWIAGNYTITISGQALIDFLQARVDDDGLVTFIIACPDSNSRGYGIGTRENTNEAYRPVLSLTYIAGGATNPQPVDGSTITDLNLPELCWDNTNVYVANVWFGAAADANALDYKDHLSLVGTVTAEDSQTPIPNVCFPIPAAELPLDVPATYFWAIETYTYPDSDPNHLGDPNELLSESVWSFSTSAIPVAQTSPVDQYKFPQESASFTVQYQSLTPLTGATWYLNDAPLAAESIITSLGGNFYEVKLNIPIATLADDGAYYCVAENDGGLSEPSDIAYLVIKRRLAYWAFEGDLTDAEGNYDGTPAVDPNFADGYTGVTDLGQALLLDGTTDSVVLPSGFENFQSGLTFSVWANPTAVRTWARFIDLGNIVEEAVVENVFLAREGTSTTLRLDTGAGALNATNAITLNEWQFFAVTVTEAGDVVMYKNGMPIQTGTVGLPVVATRHLNYIGESNWPDELFEGLLDDISVYNYALTADTIADMYAGVAGDFCRYPDIPGELDYNGNCIVDLADFAAFAASWLNCGLYPNCQ